MAATSGPHRPSPSGLGMSGAERNGDPTAELLVEWVGSYLLRYALVGGPVAGITQCLGGG